MRVAAGEATGGFFVSGQIRSLLEALNRWVRFDSPQSCPGRCVSDPRMAQKPLDMGGFYRAMLE